MVSLTSPQDEISRVANEIVALVGEGRPRGDILVLHANARGCEQMIAAIDKKLGRGAALDPKDSHPGQYVRVTTINAGTGLEAPVVFLMGLQQLFEGEHSLRLSKDDQVERILRNTRKIYMAATRARQRLVMTYVGKIPAVLESAL
jgi:ATP-dependent exoDNAse (exonuclease V) beta subunit